MGAGDEGYCDNGTKKQDDGGSKLCEIIYGQHEYFSMKIKICCKNCSMICVVLLQLREEEEVTAVFLDVL